MIHLTYLQVWSPIIQPAQLYAGCTCGLRPASILFAYVPIRIAEEILQIISQFTTCISYSRCFAIDKNLLPGLILIL